MTTDPFRQATEAAIDDIHAALSSTDQADVATASAELSPEPDQQPAAAATDAAAGHGTIRLRGQLPGPSTAVAATAPQSDPAGAADPADPEPGPAATTLPPMPELRAPASVGRAGHGIIRLQGRAATRKPTTADPVGHGTIRLHGATAPTQATAAHPVGHGTIHLHGRKPQAELGLLHTTAEGTEPEDPTTEAAREDILAAIAATA